MKVQNSLHIASPIICTLFLLFVLMGFSPPDAASHQPGTLSLNHKIEVEIDTSARLLTGVDTICCFDSDDGAITFTLGANMMVDKLLLQGREIDYRVVEEPTFNARSLTVNVSSVDFKQESLKEVPLTFYFHGTFPGFEEASRELKRGVSFINTGVIGKEGAFLPSSSGWFPMREAHTLTFDIRVTTPPGYSSVMEGDRVSEREEDDKNISRWVSSHKLDGVNISVSRFFIEEESHRGIKLYTYFLKDDKPLSGVYFDKVKEYIDIYAGILPPYPYEKFAVVESLLPTGYGMPSYTLLGSNIIRLPFIPDTSLGHEFVHNWWGNSVFIDPVNGNWAEALATYTADHLYKERAGKGEEYRRKSLEGYLNYAADRQIALKDFTFDLTTWGRAVGYNKGSFVFHMLRKLVGDDLFYASLKRFYNDNKFTFSSSRDIQIAFEAETGMDLSRFFHQWFVMAGGPVLTLTDVTRSEEKDGGHSISFLLDQGDEAYNLKVPVLIKTVDGEFSAELDMASKSQSFTLSLSSKPLSITVDPALDIFRILSYKESPPLLGSFFGSDDGYYVLPSSGEPLDKYATVANSFSGDFGQEIIDAGEAEKVISGESPRFFIFGGPGVNPFFNKYWNPPLADVSLDGDIFTVKGESFDITRSVVLIAFRDREDGEKTHVAFIGAADEAMMKSIARRVPHLTSKGYLVFTPGGGLLHGSLAGEEVLSFDFD